jgi:UDP-GlcNAc3NAcA epimerase
MKTILTVVGARPQFIKAAVLSRVIRSKEYRDSFQEILVHTGQHYDDNMSEVFFREMEIPEPDINLNVGSGSHGRMTGQMLIGIEEVILDERPDMVLVYGDTNSTLAGALAASKLHVPVAHIEAGLRSYWKAMPEEQNRVLTDHLSAWLFCPTETARLNLEREGLREGVHVVGDVMLDASLYYRRKVEADMARGVTRLPDLFDGGEPGTAALSDFYLLTIHRAENTDDPERLRRIAGALNAVKRMAVFPIHPRTRKKLAEHNVDFEPHVHLIDPVGYLEMIELELRCSFVVTDSGGMQKEAYFFKKPCVTLRDQTEWVETVESGWNRVVGCDHAKIVGALSQVSIRAEQPDFYGSGKAGQAIASLLSR